MPNKSKYRPELCEELVELMAGGLSFEACCGEFHISKTTGYEWIKRYEEFAEAKAIGEAKGQLHWEKEAMRGLFSSQDCKFNATVFIATMNNRFGWRDRKEISRPGGLGDLYKDLSPTQLQEKIQEIMSRLPKPKDPKKS